MSDFGKWKELEWLRPGAVFKTKDGVYAIKGEYRYSNERDAQFECILLASGEYAHFPNRNKELVKAVHVLPF